MTPIMMLIETGEYSGFGACPRVQPIWLQMIPRAEYEEMVTSVEASPAIDARNNRIAKENG